MTTTIASPEPIAFTSYTLPAGPKLNIGSGPVQPDGWHNIDGSNRAFLTAKLGWLDTGLTRAGVLAKSTFRDDTVYANLFKGLPYAANSASCAYAGEVWEHFEYNDAAFLTRECFRVLKPGGVLRVCVPDGMQFWPKYIALVEEQLAKPPNARDAAAIRAHMKWCFDDICTRRNFTKSFGHYHKWQFDEVQLFEMFEKAGFALSQRMPFHQSRIDDVARVERSDFLIVEGIKPLK